MTLTLTPLGTSPAFFNPGEPTSGYLLELDDVRLLVDCGAGVVARYLELYGQSQPLDAVVISHIHADHVTDLVPLGYGLTIGDLTGWPKPRLLLPPGGHARLRRMVSAFDGQDSFFAKAFAVTEYATDTPLELGPLQVTPTEVPHFIEAWALRFDARGESLTFSGDLGPTDSIVRLAQGSDLLLCEATFGAGAPAEGHLTAAQAGAIAHGANVRRLLLTHVPEAHQTDAALDAARAAFDGEVEFARSGQRYAVGAVAAQRG